MVNRFARLLVGAALFAIALAGCITTTAPSPAGKISRVKIQAASTAPADMFDAARARGAGVVELLELAGRIRSHRAIAPVLTGDDDQPTAGAGDDDMPNARTTPTEDGGVAPCDYSGPPTRELVGCNGPLCIYKWRNACARTFYQVTDGDRSTWYGPQGCPDCRP